MASLRFEFDGRGGPAPFFRRATRTADSLLLLLLLLLLPTSGHAPSGRLTRDQMVTYDGGVPEDDDKVFRALADPTRRFLLDRLFDQDGRTLTALESELDMTRFGVMKHLRLLEEAGLVVTRRSGREKLHFLNPVPIRLIHDRWIDKYTERHVSALVDLKTQLEESS